MASTPAASRVAARTVDGLGDRIVDGAAARMAGAGPEHADALALLGEVDQLEVEGERLGHGGRPREVQGRDLGRQALALEIRLQQRLGITAAERDRATADALDEREQLRPALLRDHLPEQRAEQADLAGEGIPGAADPGPGRLRGDGGEPGTRGATRCGRRRERPGEGRGWHVGRGRPCGR